MSIYSKTAAGWVEVAGGSSKAALSSWGRVVGEPEGAVTSAYINLEDGSNWQYWEFNTPGDYEIDLGNGGLFWVLCVSAGSNGYNTAVNLNQGSAGRVNEGLWEFGPGVHSVTVGATVPQSTQLSGWSGIDDRVTGFGTQTGVNFGWQQIGAGSVTNDNLGYVSTITGEPLEYATGGENGAKRPGRGAGVNTLDAEPGTVIIATRIDVEQLAPAPAELAPAPVLGAPVKVSGSADVLEYIVRQTDGSRKKIYMLPGNTTRGDENVFEVTLGAGVLPGVMVAAGGSGGGRAGSDTRYGGGGGAGGVIGTGCHVPVILPVQGTATYTVKVASATNDLGGGQHIVYSGQSTTLAVQGQQPFTAAVGGGAGQGVASGGHPTGGGSAGGSGGGSWSEPASNDAPYVTGGMNVPGQGNRGGAQTSPTNAGSGGGGYGSAGSGPNGGSGFDLASALQLDSNDGATATFLAAVSVDGFIAGGGAGNNGTATAGGGLQNADAKDYTGSGGGGHITRGAGGCGAVYIITDA